MVGIGFPDGTREGLTHYGDGTVETRTTRDGIKVRYLYDAANRLESATPELEDDQVLPDGLIPLDAGDFFDYDELSRPTGPSSRGCPAPLRAGEDGA